MQPWSDVCRRCRCDLALLHQTLRAAQQWRERSLNYWAAGDVPRAEDAARRSFVLDPQSSARRLWAVCAAAQGVWPLAHRLALADEADDAGPQ
jgi:hypothetical protein